MKGNGSMSERTILEKLIEDGKDAERKLKELDRPVKRHGDVFESVFSRHQLVVVVGNGADAKGYYSDGSRAPFTGKATYRSVTPIFNIYDRG